MARHRVQKSRSVKGFRKRASKSHRMNFAGPMRGGIRL